MARTIANVAVSTDSFQTWLNQTNKALDALTNEVITVSTTAAGGNATVANTTGNAQLLGVFGANTIVATNGLRGGNVTTSASLNVSSNASISGDLSVTANSALNNTTVSGLLTVTGNATFSGDVSTFNKIELGNSTVNALANSTILKISNSTASANLTPIDLTIGSMTLNSTSLSVGTGNFSSGANVGANVNLTTTGINIGNSTVNATANSSKITVGNAFVNSTTLSVPSNVLVGSNVSLNTSSVSIGNSSSNVKISANGGLVATGNSSLNVASVNSLTALGDVNINEASPLLIFKDTDAANTSEIGSYIEWKDSTDTRAGFFGYGSTASPILTLANETDGGAVYFQSNGSTRATIAANGNIGIGTASPNYTLDVSGDLEVTSQIFLASPSTSYSFNCGGQGAFDSNLWTLSNIFTVPVAGTTPSTADNDASRVGTYLSSSGFLNIARVSGPMLVLNRKTTDGGLAYFYAQGTSEGYITVSGTTVSYVGFMGSHWGSLEDRSTPDILPGTILETIDKLIEWKIAVFEKDGVTIRMAYNGSANAGDTVQITYEGQQYLALIQEEQPDQELNKHVCVKVNDTPASPAVFGVFLGWESDSESEQEDEDGIKGKWNDMQVASLGNYFIRVAANETIQIGNLIEADGNGCGKVQDDDIIRSKTIGKITSTIKQKIYDDGSYLVTAVLYCG